MTERKRKLWLALGLVALVLLVLGLAPFRVRAQGGQIQGTVQTPDGGSLPAGTKVKLYDPAGQELHGAAAVDPATGAFALGPVPNGLYLLRAEPPLGSGYTPSLPKVVSIFNGGVNVGILTLTLPQVEGTVFAPDGSTPVTATVVVETGSGRPLLRTFAPNGRFQLGGLPTGSYALWAYPEVDLPYWRSQPQGVTIPSLSATQTVTLTLQPARLWGRVEDPAGAPVRNATVVAVQGGVYRATRSRPSGFWALGDLPDGTYLLAALPPWTRPDLRPSTPLSVSLPGATNPYTLTLRQGQKTLQGTVQTQAGTPVEGAQVVARRLDRRGRAEATTDATGAYQLHLSSGLWSVTVRSVSGTVPADWVYPQPPQLVRFRIDPLPETKTLDFTVLVADAQVVGQVRLPDGVTTPPFTVTVGFFNDEGVGRRVTVDPADGSFQVRLPSGGYKVVVHAADPGYLGPVLAPIQVPVSSTYDLGTLLLLARDARITGTVRTTAGIGVEGIPVVAWRPGAPGALRTVSGPDGVYALAVASGTWQVRPVPRADQPYLYVDPPAEVTLAAGETVTDVNFTLLDADAQLQGILVDPNGLPVPEVEGWVEARSVLSPTLRKGGPVANGTFTLTLPAGTYRVAVHLPSGSPYLSAGERQVVVSGTTVLTLTVKPTMSRIVGALWDVRRKMGVSGVAGAVAAWQDGLWAAAPIDPGNGTYELEVAGGLWRLNYRIDPTAGYVKGAGPRTVAVADGKTTVVPLPVLERDGTITGTVLAPDGSPLPGAHVWARGVGPELDGLVLRTRSRADGTFRLEVPHGTYRLGATAPNRAFLNPVERTVTVPAGGVSGGHVLRFRLPDAVLTGTLTVTPTTASGIVHLFAWSEDGAYVRARVPVTQSGGVAVGAYRLEVSSGTTWHLVGVFETARAYWIGRASVPVQGPTAQQDLTLTGPNPKPAPVVVTFDASEPQTLLLEDGTRIFIPAHAFPVTGTVTLRIVPVAGLPAQRHGQVVGYGYAFLASDAEGAPIEGHFNQEVVIRFPYDEARLRRLGISEDRLKPAYFSTTEDRWVIPESYVVDTEANVVTMQIDHFTDFALVASGGYALYLPLLLR